MIQRFTRFGGLALAALVLAGSTFARAESMQETQGETVQDPIPGSKKPGKPTTRPAPAPAPAPPTTSGRPPTDPTAVSTLDERQRAMIGTMSARNAQSIELGQLATQRGASGEVKQLGQRMVSEYQALEADLARVASDRKENLSSIPKDQSGQAEHRKLMERLQKLSGPEFDRELVLAVRDLQAREVEDLKRMRGEISDKNPAMKGWLDANEDRAEARLAATRQVKQTLDGQRAAAK
jgi:putative membrane protein